MYTFVKIFSKKHTMTFLQITEATEVLVQDDTSISLFSVIMKGGWIMIPIFILAAIAIFLISDTWVSVKRLNKVNGRWFAHLLKLVDSGDMEQAISVATKSSSAMGKVAVAGLSSCYLPEKNIEEDMQVETRQVLAKPEGNVGYLGTIATIAPMLGFLGTIFGVIKIFFNISLTNDLSISSISDGLYQKMICSGAGLLVGIVAYIGYYLLSRYLDTMVLGIDKGANELLKAMTVARTKSGNRI
jgi:biopolymer transport protein ExbB